MNTNRVKIEKIVNGGYGLGRLNNGQIIFLHNSLEGETVQYRILEERKNMLFGAVDVIVTKNSARTTPPCPYYGKCGGCNLQHCSYDKQRQIKNSIITELLQSIPEPNLVIRPILQSPQQLGYRQRIRLKNSIEKIGFLKFRSEEIVSIKSCLIAHPAINQVFGELLTIREFDKLRIHTDEVELLFNPSTSMVSCVFHYRRKPRPADNRSAEKLVEEIEDLERVFFTGIGFSLTGPFSSKTNPNTSRLFSQLIHPNSSSTANQLTWEVGGFCQVNLQQNVNLINYVLQKCGDVSTRTILDLFCGMGNFSIPLALSARSLLGIEGQGAAIRCAKKNSLTAELDNTHFIKGTIHQVCGQLTKENKQYDIIILDPPRQGIPGLTPLLASLTDKKILYISCDPATLCRDLADLCNHGFKLKEVQPVDMFPQTHHIETVAVLEKN